MYNPYSFHTLLFNFMKQFIQFSARLFLVFFICFGSSFPVFGQNEDVEIDLSFLDSLETALIITDKKK